LNGFGIFNNILKLPEALIDEIIKSLPEDLISIKKKNEMVIEIKVD